MAIAVGLGYARTGDCRFDPLAQFIGTWVIKYGKWVKSHDCEISDQ